MKKTIFYSWQSDLPNRTNRNFILDALEKAAKAIGNDDAIDVEPVIDRDTAGVAGTPDIASTIFQKIDSADVIVLDVSIITPQGVPRSVPNPNVLIELGYAVRSRGWGNVLLVMNRAFGTPEQLPFDLRSRRVTTYAVAEGADETARKEAKRSLLSVLEEALRGALVNHVTAAVGEVIEPRSAEQVAHEAIQSGGTNREGAVRRFTSSIFEQLEAVRPKLGSHNDSFETLRSPLEQTMSAVEAFGRTAALAAEMLDEIALKALYDGLEPIAASYNAPRVSGTFFSHQFDFWRFLGHELFLTLIAVCVRGERWEFLAELLQEGLIIPNTESGRGAVSFQYHRQPVRLIYNASQLIGSPSPRAKLLSDRHPPTSAVEFEALADADIFLFMRSELPPEVENEHAEWWVESVMFLDHLPRFLIKAERVPYARRLATAIGLQRPELLRERLIDRRHLLVKGRRYPESAYMRDILSEEAINKIASRP